MSRLYCAVTNTSNITAVNITANHDNPVAQATIDAGDTSLTLGDEVIINGGYSDNHAQLFKGYVKQIDKKVPDNTYSITAYDNLVRAQDYFIASSNPDTPFSRQNISAENLVRDLLALSGLTSFTYTATSFTFGIQNKFDINLVNVIDYVKNICDILTWTLWADENGTVHFENRKPYVMDGSTGQPGDHEDVPVADILVDEDLAIDVQHTKSERSLRNRVVVYGATGIHAEASGSSTSLPSGFYKSAVLAYPQLIDSNDLAQDIANYNLNLLKRITETISLQVIGDVRLKPRTVINLSIPSLSISGAWYVYGCDHRLGQSGFLTSLDVKRMIPD